ncbi:MAG TPA: hypothetical protein VMX57_09765, partial [Planctomycetota bacterium]|nr:hypothetical protein [Planctomycetota bacterium]
MRTDTTVFVMLLVAGALLSAGPVGCGYGPMSQPYAIESGAEPVSLAVGDDRELTPLIEQMRLAKLNLADQLTLNAPTRAVDAASSIIMLSREMSKFQPAIALSNTGDAARFKRLIHDVEDMAVESAKAADAQQMGLADRYYVRCHMRYNEWLRLFRGVPDKPTDPMEIPELEERKPEPEPAAEAPAEPAPAPEIPAPAPEIPAPAPETPAGETVEAPAGTELPEAPSAAEKLDAMIKKMRTEMLHLADRLTSGTPRQAAEAAVRVSLQARLISDHDYQVALAPDAPEEDRKSAEEEKTAFKRTILEVQGLAVDCAQAADLGKMDEADNYYARLYLTYNQWNRFFTMQRAAPPVEEMPIPGLDRGP